MRRTWSATGRLSASSGSRPRFPSLLRVPGGSLAVGAPADITILAPDLSVTVDKAKLVSKSKNTPYHGWSFTGGVAATIVGGRTVYTNPQVGLI